MIRHKKSATLVTVASVLGLLVFAAACVNQKVVQVGSHKVILSRHGSERKFRVTTKASIPTMEYEGRSNDGVKLKVTIKGDEVRVNDSDYGKLRPGDSVFIGDSGLAVNELSYAESEKYLRANGSTAESTAQN